MEKKLRILFITTIVVISNLNLKCQDIEEKIDSLSPEYKDPFILHFKGFKYKEIADQLNIPIGTVKSRIFIARKKLIDLLPDYSYTLN